MFKKHIHLRKINAEFFCSEPSKGVKELKVRRQPMASRKRFQIALVCRSWGMFWI